MNFLPFLELVMILNIRFRDDVISLRMVQIQASSSTIFSIFYFIFSLGKIIEAFHQLNSQISGFIFQFREFDSAGVSPEALLSYNDWVGSEEVRLYT